MKVIATVSISMNSSLAYEVTDQTLEKELNRLFDEGNNRTRGVVVKKVQGFEEVAEIEDLDALAGYIDTLNQNMQHLDLEMHGRTDGLGRNNSVEARDTMRKYKSDLEMLEARYQRAKDLQKKKGERLASKVARIDLEAFERMVNKNPGLAEQLGKFVDDTAPADVTE